jgi:hypothetical protein
MQRLIYPLLNGQYLHRLSYSLLENSHPSKFFLLGLMKFYLFTLIDESDFLNSEFSWLSTTLLKVKNCSALSFNSNFELLTTVLFHSQFEHLVFHFSLLINYILCFNQE